MKWKFICLLLLILFCSHIPPVRINRWTLYKKLNGVEFYVKHASSRYDTRYNTLVRLRNMNRFEVRVTFNPMFGCKDSDEKVTKNLIRTSIYPRHAVTLLAYRPCSGRIPTEVIFSNLSVKRR